MDLKEHIVGKVEGYPVIYIEEKDTIFCKNTAVKYSLLKRLYDSPFSREKIEEKSLTITKEEHFVTFGCLTTTKEYCQTVIKNINKIKNELIKQKESKFKGNIYHYSQVNFAYNSNKIQDTHLSENETEEIFVTNSYISKEDDVVKLDDLIEMNKILKKGISD